jgi:hypothetical protein
MEDIAMKFRGVQLMFAAMAAMALFASGGSAEAAQFNPPKHFYLALGDSNAFGAQLGKFFQELSTGTYDPASFNMGYVDDFAARMKTIDPHLETVNLSCPAESTSTFLGQGALPFTNCPFRVLLPQLALHTNYSGSQESAALTFLREHPGQVSPITIDIGLGDAIFPCAGPTFLINVPCFHSTMPTALVSVAHNLPKILADLHKASPSSEIIVATYYNPFYVQDPSTDDLVVSLNEEITSIATSAHAQVADAFQPFNRTGDETITICTLTLMCPGLDYHPSDLGYAVIAKQFWTASGYGRLGE